MRWEFPDGELDTEAYLGAVTDRSVRVWVRAPGVTNATAQLLVENRPVAEARVTPDPQHDFIDAVTLELSEPAPNAAFTVRSAGLERHARFTPEPGGRIAYSFAFGSCHQPFLSTDGERLRVHGGAGIYPAMIRSLHRGNCRFLVLLGDQMYSDGVDVIKIRRDLKRTNHRFTDEDIIGIYRHLYRGYFGERGFRTLLAERPTYFIWDDHDIYDGAGSLVRPDDTDRRLFSAAEVAYREYQHLRNPGGSLEDRAPYDYSFWLGDTGFFVLDLRGRRDYGQGILLGDQQWQHFDEFLDSAVARGAPTLFIVASVPVTHFPPWVTWFTDWEPAGIGRDIRDRWSTEVFRSERMALLTRLFDWQAAHPQRQVFILSGDVHAAAAFRMTRPRGAGAVWQWTSSPLTTPTSRAQHIGNRIGSHLINFGDLRFHAERHALVLRNNFGWVDLLPLPDGGHQVTLSIYGYHHDSQTVTAEARVVSRPGG